MTEKPGVEGTVFGSNDNWKGLGIFLDSFDNDAAVSDYKQKSFSFDSLKEKSFFLNNNNNKKHLFAISDSSARKL